PTGDALGEEPQTAPTWRPVPNGLHLDKPAAFRHARRAGARGGLGGVQAGWIQWDRLVWDAPHQRSPWETPPSHYPN
ncbi:MAG: hypothetical protein Q8Q29_03780, partial [Actinomycetota bacterium]|nr:hypothetical protein [Actinomycetota bacterium]